MTKKTGRTFLTADIVGYEDSFIVNDRYEIYKFDGCVYDTTKGQDIPAWVFKIRDELVGDPTQYVA